MPVRRIEGTDTQYHLISFDEHGVERLDGDRTLPSEMAGALLMERSDAVTDVFLASHGWKGDVPAAIEQNDSWIGAMARSPDRGAIARVRPGFRALNIGLHWPSLPFGDESLPNDEPSRTLSADDDGDVERAVSQFAGSIADTPGARDAIRTILLAAREDDGGAAELPAEVRDAYDRLFAEAALDGIEDIGAAPGEDHPALDAAAMYRAARESADQPDDASDSLLLGGGGWLGKLKGLMVMPLQQASFWKMKERARRVGESGVHSLLVSLMKTAPTDTRFHLMGHSFGCIVVSAAVAGPAGGTPLPRAVDTLFLVQGALSLWSFCESIPSAPGTAGYFHRIVREGLVRGPIVTTRSSFDKAVGKLYPPAATLKHQLTLGDEFPKFGGIGSFGAQGLGLSAVDATLGPADHDYRFEPKRVYNLEASGIIKNGGGFSGAHSDITHPEVAHAMWQAVAVS